MGTLDEVTGHANIVSVISSSKLTGARLRVLRKRHGISAYAVAQAIGVTPPAVYQWEAGSRKIHPAMAKLLTLYFEGKLQPVEPQESRKRR